MGDLDKPRSAVGFIGLGNMGAAIAERLLEAGYQLSVYNRSPEKAEPLAAHGAVVAGSIAELAEHADVILTSLANDEALEDVGAQILDSARAGTVLIELSTVSATASARIAALADRAKIAYLRAPVSGNPAVVRAGNLAFIVSGPQETLGRVEPLLRAIGPTIHHVGDGEQARVVKLAINLMIGGLAELMSEALVLGEAAGVSRRDLLTVMGNSAVGAPFVKYKTEPLLRDDYSATFTTSLMEKDIDLALEVADEAGLALPMTRELKELLRNTIAAGYGDSDFMALYLTLGSAQQAVPR